MSDTQRRANEALSKSTDPELRKAALLGLADAYGVDRRDNNSSGEDLAELLAHPTRIQRYVAITRSPETGIVYLDAECDSLAVAKTSAMEHVEDDLYEEVPVAVYDLDERTIYPCTLRPVWEGETHNGFPVEDSAALDNLAKYLNDQESWSGADACEVFAEALMATGREITA